MEKRERYWHGGDELHGGGGGKRTARMMGCVWRGRGRAGMTVAEGRE
jgi:hypothetical protein